MSLEPTNEQTVDVVDVTVLLTGGHEYTVALSPKEPLLRQLLEAAIGDAPEQRQKVFQLPLHRGRSGLVFRGDRLVGLITDPPITLQPRPSSPHPAPLSTSSTQSSPVPTFTSPPAKPEVLPSQYVQLDNFLSQADHKRLLKYVNRQRANFVPTTTSTGAENYRQSVVLHSFPEFVELITQKIHGVLPEVLDQLKLPRFSITQVEAQLTAHNHGNFYKVHNDNGSPETATRELTYVYYFYKEPKPFTGGELLLYDSRIENNFYVQAESWQAVEPRNNSIVFFLSRYMHEVLPVQCPSQNFSDSRFTINGWIRR
jgi:Rps23 Pro-64 3,4-dihydroxylase Tpa1-like proline 4-hydroxylase